MGLTDDPMYKYLTQGEDSHLLLGTMRIVAGGRELALPVFIVDYYNTPESMDKVIQETFDPLKKVILLEKNGTYTLSADNKTTTVMFAEGEVASHTAPIFWVEYTPTPEEHKSFQEALKKAGVWMFMIVTKSKLREFIMSPEGVILHRNTSPMTEQILKTLNLA